MLFLIIYTQCTSQMYLMLFKVILLCSEVFRSLGLLEIASVNMVWMKSILINNNFPDILSLWEKMMHFFFFQLLEFFLPSLSSSLLPFFLPSFLPEGVSWYFQNFYSEEITYLYLTKIKNLFNIVNWSMHWGENFRDILCVLNLKTWQTQTLE